MLWFVLGILLLLVVAFLSLKIKVAVRIQNGSLTASAKLLWFRLFTHPPTNAAKEPAATKKSKENEGVKEEPSWSPEAILHSAGELLQLLKEAAGIVYRKIIKRIVVSRFLLHWTVAREDACETALSYGTISSLVYNGLSLLSQLLTVHKPDVSVVTDFQKTSDEVELVLDLHLRIVTLLACGLRLLILLIKNKALIQSIRKGA